jgi:translation initiation factor 6
MHVKQVTVSGSSSIGLYAHVTDDVAIVAESAQDSFIDDVKSVLDVPVITTTVAGTNLVGAFLTGNDHAVLIPDIIEDHEQTRFDDADITIKEIPTTYTCLGNNVLANNDAAIVNPEFSDAETKRISDALDVSATEKSLAGVETIGTLAAFNNDAAKLVISNEISEEEYGYVSDVFNADVTASSVNMGAAQIGCGVLCNKNGVLIGAASGGPEMTMIDNGLGYND